jgi:hypothetical protein
MKENKPNYNNHSAKTILNNTTRRTMHNYYSYIGKKDGNMG